MKTKIITSFIILSFVFAPALFCAPPTDTIGMPKDYSEAELKALINKPRVVPGSKPEVSLIDGDKWILTYSDVEIVTDAPIGKVYFVLNDFPNYKKNFENSSGAKVLSETKEGKLIEAKGVGGLITYDYIQSEPKNSADEHLLVRKGDKGTSGKGENDFRNMDTQYYIKTVKIDGKDYTYLRDRDYTEVRSLPFAFSKLQKGDLQGHLDGLTELAEVAGKQK